MVLQKIENDHNLTGNPVRSQEKTAYVAAPARCPRPAHRAQRVQEDPRAHQPLCHFQHERGERGDARVSASACRDPLTARSVLQRDSQLTDFERIQLANLAPHESEEAKSLIPSYVLGSPVPADGAD